MWKWIIGFVVLVLVLVTGGGVYLWQSGTLKTLMEKMNPEAGGMKVRLETVERGTLIRSISAPGIVEPRTKVEISAQVSARIIALPFREGDFVKKGDVLIRLNGEDLAAALDSAKAQEKRERAQLEGAQARLANAGFELGRRKELFASKDISKAELDQAEADFQAAQSSVNQSKHSIEAAQASIQRATKDLENTVIKADFDGVVTKLDAEVGELVVVGTLNNPGSVIMEVANLTDVLMKARVDEANIAPVVAGQRAKIFVNAYPDKDFAGTVERVGLKKLTDKDGSSYFETEIKIDVPEGITLRSGLTCNADIGVQTLADVVKVPSQAILDRAVDELPAEVSQAAGSIDPGKKFARVIFAMKDGKAEALPVGIGPSDLTHTVIFKGLEPGTKIVVGPFKTLLALKHDQRISDEALDKKPGTGSTTGETKIAGAADGKEKEKHPEPKPQEGKPEPTKPQNNAQSSGPQG
ncbi:MAG: efflux RND transporter periplasmic adaptor subunit [Planctomycetota bacterium]|nr:efflux RND transporter periplasmic adaptor subunit [Planctomycetota bacterium]